MSDVLLVDDDPAVLRLLNLTFRSTGLTTDTASNGAEALERVEESEPAAVVVDLQMPVMDGSTFVKELRERRYETPVLVLSAHATPDVRRRIAADAFVSKPFHPDVLVEEVKRIIPAAA